MFPRVLRVLGVALIVILAFEGALRGFGNRLGPPLTWYSMGAQTAVADMNRLSNAGMTSDVVFVGTSMIRWDVQISIIEAEVPSIRRASNMALPAAQTPVVRKWLLDQVVPRLHPERVVWGVQSLDFNGGRRQPTIERYDSGLAVRTGFFASLDQSLSSLFALSRFRATLRNPRFVVDFLRAQPSEAGAELEDLLSPTNVGHRADEGKTLTEFHRIQNAVLGGFVIGSREVADFEYTIEALKAQGIDVVVVLMPIPDDYVQAHPNGEVDFSNFQDWLSGEVASLGVPYFDHSRTMRSNTFFDYTHLASAGAREFSDLLAADLLSLGW